MSQIRKLSNLGFTSRKKFNDVPPFDQILHKKTIIQITFFYSYSLSKFNFDLQQIKCYQIVEKKSKLI